MDSRPPPLRPRSITRFSPMFLKQYRPTHFPDFWKRYCTSLIAGWKGRHVFQEVRGFGLFIGYPRSGHSMMAALLDAHPHMMFSHEVNALRALHKGFPKMGLYGLILRQAAAFAAQGANGLGHVVDTSYDYAVPNQWQGRYDKVLVAGDKQAPATTAWLAGDFTLLARLSRTLGVPVRLIHMIRNPLANISGIYRLKRKRGMTPTLQDAINYYFEMADGVRQVQSLAGASLKDVYLEDLIARPQEILADVCAFLGVVATEDYLRDCASILFAKPRHTVEDTGWTPAQIEEVKERMRRIPFLARYDTPQQWAATPG
jgi:hypothetical protein